MCNFKAYLFLLAAIIALFVGAFSARAFNYELLYWPVEQSTSKTCQSYVLAMALAMHEPVNDPTWRWRVETAEQLEDLELAIRAEILRANKNRIRNATEAKKKADTRILRGDWDRAIRTITDGEFAHGREVFATQEELLDWLGARVPNTAVTLPRLPFAVSTPMTLYAVSVETVDGFKHGPGHIVSVLGVDFNVNPGTQPALLLINSFSMASDRACYPPARRGHWAGHAAWTSNYEIKAHENRYGVDFIKRTSQ